MSSLKPILGNYELDKKMFIDFIRRNFMNLIKEARNKEKRNFRHFCSPLFNLIFWEYMVGVV